MSRPFAGRLAAVRNLLKSEGVDAFYLQRTDSHASEYLPADAERVAWLTGFTGSAAIAVIGFEQAAVFSDGRYSLQLQNELDDALFEACHITQIPPAKWLTQKMKPGSVIGYDPMLTKSSERVRLQVVASQLDGELRALSINPIDACWTDRPPPAAGGVTRLNECYAGESSVDKRARLGAEISQAGADLYLLAGADNIAWLLNIRGNDIPFNPLCLSYALLNGDGTCRWFVESAKLPSGLIEDHAVTIAPYNGFVDALHELKGKAVLLDPALTHVGFIDAIEQAGGRVIKANDPVVVAKAQKNAVERGGCRAAHRRDGAAIVRFLAWLDSISLDGSIDELAAAERLLAERWREALFQGPSFETITGHGPNGAIVHYRATPATSRPLTADTLYLFDSGGQYLDATTDITRTVVLGTPSAAMRACFTAVLKGHISLARAVFPDGTNGGQLDMLARQHLWRLGLDYDHGTGHGVGSYLCVHEGPARIAKVGASAALKPGMILSNEPGYYKADAFGIRIENLVIVKQAGMPDGAERELLEFETVTRAPIDRRLIEISMLDRTERAWIDAYHQCVIDDIGPLLDDAGRGWLGVAAAPL